MSQVAAAASSGQKQVSLKLLNHASFLLSTGGVSLLFDPWYEGACFRGGWGLSYDNPDAYADAAGATHLWISHFHGDHLHLPTLRKIAQKNPSIRVLANVSANFEMKTPLTAAGFQNVAAFSERQTIEISSGVRVTRYPCTGIDNMLAVNAAGLTVLNLNDCNLPKEALSRLVKKMGSVDVLLVNFNHAYKLMDGLSDEAVKDMLKKRFLAILEAVRPRFVIPFASMHYYRATQSADQNRSMLDLRDLTALDPRVMALGFGDTACFASGQNPVVIRKTPPLALAARDEKIHDKPASWEEILSAAEKFRRRLRKNFLGLKFGLSPLVIRVSDLGRAVLLDISKRVCEVPAEDAQIEAHSQSIMEWMAGPYGTDAFFVGADFAVLDPDTRALKRLLLAGDFADNGLSPRHLLGMVLTLRGIPFLWFRREEIFSILKNRRLTLGYRT